MMIEYYEFQNFAGKYLSPFYDVFVQKIPIQNHFGVEFFLIVNRVSIFFFCSTF